MFSREEFVDRLKLITDTETDSERMYDTMRELERDFDDRTKIVDDFSQKTFYEEKDVFDNDGIRWSEKYDNLSRQYRDRFFSSINEAIDEQEEDISKDDRSTTITFDDLFSEREGDYK